MVAKSTRTSDIWNLFRNRLVADVTSVTLNDSSTSTIQRYSASFSQESFNSSSNFPMMIIEDPTFTDDSETFTKELTDGDIVVEIYSTSAQAATKFADAILNSIETYKLTLADNGLQKVHGSLEDVDNIENGSIMIHIRTIKFKFEFRYSKTLAY